MMNPSPQFDNGPPQFQQGSSVPRATGNTPPPEGRNSGGGGQQLPLPAQLRSPGVNPGASFSTSIGGSKTVAKRARPRKTPNKIDSAQVPTPARDLPFASPQSPRPMVGTLKGYAPLSITNFVAVDEGSASAKFMRPTLHSAPTDESFLKDSGMPWSVVLSPLFDQLEAVEERVPVVTGRPPVRCHRCRAYMTAQTPFTDLGKRWNCIFCGMGNDTEPEYFCNLDSYGRRRDVMEKPELCRGSVEYDVSQLVEYALKNEAQIPLPNRPMSHLFLVDVSMDAKRHLPSLVEAIRLNIYAMAERTPRCRVSFVTYADSLHFYNFSMPSMPQLIVPDVDAPFVPLPFTLLCWLNVADDAARIDEFLERLLGMPDLCEETGCAAGAAVKAASMILSETGGKVILTATQAPTLGVGTMVKRDTHKLYTPETEKQLFHPIEGFWPGIALECAKKNISVDVITFPSNYCEMVTFGAVPHLTGGQQATFLNFAGETDQHRLVNMLRKTLVEEAGYGAIVRLRCSQGIRVVGYHGHFASNDPQDMDLAGVSSSNTFVVDLKHEGKIDPKSVSFLQLALLYTTRAGERRVRVHTIRMTVCNVHATLFRHSDLEATIVTMLYHTIHTAVNKGTKAAREALTASVLAILASYRRFCASSSHTGQLLLPEALKLLPLYSLCAMKSDALVSGTSATVDQRTQSMFDLMSMPITHVLSYLYPRLYALQTTLNHPTTGVPRDDGVKGVYMPPLQQLTTDTIMCHGVYALLDRQINVLYLWVGSSVSPRVSSALFGIEDATQLDLTSFDKWHDRVKSVISQLMDEGMARLILIHEGSGGVEESFFRCMLEDEVPSGQTYSEFLCMLHRQISTKLA
jgi:protein transport protein SEC24